MRKAELLAANNMVQEYRSDSWIQRRRYHRMIEKRLRYVCPPDMSLAAALEALFWILLAAACFACVVALPVMFVRWWLCV